jgi:hypothetical protein
MSSFSASEAAFAASVGVLAQSTEARASISTLNV